MLWEQCAEQSMLNVAVDSLVSSLLRDAMPKVLSEHCTGLILPSMLMLLFTLLCGALTACRCCKQPPGGFERTASGGCAGRPRRLAALSLLGLMLKAEEWWWGCAWCLLNELGGSWEK